jgi:hypothetical protein
MEKPQTKHMEKMTVITVKPFVEPVVGYTVRMSSGLGATYARGGTMASVSR